MFFYYYIIYQIFIFFIISIQYLVFITSLIIKQTSRFEVSNDSQYMPLLANGKPLVTKSMTSQIQKHQQGNQAMLTQKDTRQQVKDASQYPFCCIGKIICHFKTKDKQNNHITINKVGTAAIVHKKFILTSAHVIYYQKSGQIADQIQFYLEPSKTKISVIGYYFNQQYFNKICPDQANFDFVFLQLQNSQHIGQNNVLPINFNYKWSQQNKNQNILISGYSENPHVINQKQKYQAKPAYKQNNGFLMYKHNTEPGQSGAPVLLRTKNQQYQIIGIHKGTFGNVNYCLLSSLMKKSKQALSGFIQKYQLQLLFRDIYIPSIEIKLRDYQRQIKELQKQNTKLKQENKNLKSRINLNHGPQQSKDQQVSEKLAAPDSNSQITKTGSKFDFSQQIKSQLNQKLQKSISNQQNQSLIKEYVKRICKEQSQISERYHINTQKQIESYEALQQKLTSSGYTLDHRFNELNAKQFFQNKDWNHIQFMDLSTCWIDDKGWRQLVSNANKFTNLKSLFIWNNSITTIMYNDLDAFKSLQFIDLRFNKLSQQSTLQLKRYKQDHPKVYILLAEYKSI